MLSEQSAIVTDTHGSWSLNGKVWERWKAGVCLGVATALERETIEAAYALGQRGEHAEAERMKAFVVAVMSAWPTGEIDAADLQELGIEHGLLKLQEPSPTKPCGDGCMCAEYCDEKEFADGLVQCYRKTYMGEQP